MYFVALLVISCASHVIASPFNKSLTLGYDTSLENDEDKTYPPGIKFLGGGYDLIKGNPDNRRSDNAGADPGLHPSRRILHFTKGDKKTIQRGFDLYDEIAYTPRSACVKEKSNSIVKDTQSYQNELSVGVSLGASYEGVLAKAAFTASAEYKKMTEETITNKKVYSEERETCLYGDATYSWAQLQRGNFHVSEEFAAAVCQLPEEYDEAKYRNFVNSHGTHVVVEADLGTKTIKVFEATTAEFTEFALEQNKASVSVEAGYGKFSGSLSVDFDRLKKSTKAGCEFGSQETEFTIGTEERPEPIKIELKPLTDLFVKEMYKEESLEKANCVLEEATLETRKGHLLTFFSDYPQLLHVVLPQNQEVTLDLNWPKGTYGLPRPDGGCPTGSGFTWHEGKYFQDNEDTEDWQKGSEDNHLDMLIVYDVKWKNSQQRFCVKTQNTPDNLIWPRGSYCINKKGDCPNGFTEGKVTWNDEKKNNGNEKSGALPDGDQWQGDNPGTRVEYCCRTDDYPENEIFLPYNKPFFLYMAPDNHECQKVYKMDVKSEWFCWNTEDDNSKNKIEGTVPKGVYGDDIKQFYCYYTPKS